MPAATTISALTSLGGLVFSAVGAAQQASAQRDRDRYQEAVARNNAIIAAQNAEAIRESGEVAKSERRELIKRHKGTVKAVFAANGFLVDDPDPDSTVTQTLAAAVEAGELDINRLDDRVKAEQRRAQIQGDQFVAQARLFDLKASQSSPFGSFATTLLGDAGDVALKLKSANLIS